MAATPHRLKAKRTPLLRRQARDVVENGSILPTNPNRRISRPLRAIRRFVLVLLWTLISMAIQAVLLFAPGRGKIGFARVYWAVTCRLFGVRVRTIGVPARRGAGGRPVVFVSNHSSWLDILVLGGRLEACFVSKREVGSWPVVSLIARLGRTVFVRRSRASTARERDDMSDRLRGGDSLILFPEGTSSDGSRVLPFRSAFLSVAEQPVTEDGLPPLVQPVSVVYDRLGYLPTGRASRPVFAWYGDMNLGAHAWRLAQFRGLRATVLLHAPLDPRAFPDRKALARAAFAAVANGAATLRQNRPARPIGAEAEPAGGNPVPAFGL
jgi:1-acyl-sn-glycerol-3-phosphate acyltransferase